MKQILLILVVLALAGCGKKSLDPILEKAVRSELKKPTGELTKADLEKVKELYLDALELTKLPRGLEKLTQLEVLSAYGNNLTDVSGLENLTKFEALGIMDNKLTELPKGLENLTQLENLWLSGNQLTDVKGLEKLTQLRVLNISHNPDLTKAQIDELLKALPTVFYTNPKK